MHIFFYWLRILTPSDNYSSHLGKKPCKKYLRSFVSPFFFCQYNESFYKNGYGHFFSFTKNLYCMPDCQKKVSPTNPRGYKQILKNLEDGPLQIAQFLPLNVAVYWRMQIFFQKKKPVAVSSGHTQKETTSFHYHWFIECNQTSLPFIYWTTVCL